MKKLKSTQVGPWCSYCPPKTVRATFRQHGFSGEFCCDAHRSNLHAEEVAQAAKDEYMTEADYQTWGKL